MRYLCVHCDHRFEHEGEETPRCPKCMRQHGIEKLGESSDASGAERSRSRALLLAGMGLGVLVLVGGGYVWWAQQAPPDVEGEPPVRPLSQEELKAYLDEAKAGIGDARELLLASDEVEEFAQRAAGEADGAVARARSVTRGIRERAEAEAFVPWSMNEPRDAPPRPASATVKRLGEDGAEERLYPLEVAAVAASALRTLDVDAMVAEAWGFAEAQAPPDPSGYFGYYVVAVFPQEPGKGEPALFDPYGGRSIEAEKVEFRVLTDVQAVAAAANHRSIYALVHEGDTETAFNLSEAALELDERSASVRTVRGIVLLRTGGINEGLKQLRSAVQLRDDGPRHNKLAVIHLSQGSIEKASKEVTAALEGNPEYAAGHATLAQVHLSKGETDRARTELQRAEGLDPDLHLLPLLWSQYYIRVGETEKAVERARVAIKRRPNNWQTRLRAAQVLRAGGYYDDMRRQARKIMELVPEERETPVRKMIEQVLGPTAFDEPLGPLDGGVGEMPGAIGDFDLGKSSALLGDGGTAGGGGGPSLLGDQPSLLDGPGPGGPLPAPGSGSKLRLRDPGKGLKLDMSE